jgi:hypothetical protein
MCYTSMKQIICTADEDHMSAWIVDVYIVDWLCEQQITWLQIEVKHTNNLDCAQSEKSCI